MKKHRKTVLAAIMLILVVASAVFAARVHTVSLDAENVAKITAKSTVTQAPPDEIVLTAESQASATLSVFKNLGRRFPAKTFSRTIVNKIDNIIYSLLRNCTKIETFRKEET